MWWLFSDGGNFSFMVGIINVDAVSLFKLTDLREFGRNCSPIPRPFTEFIPPPQSCGIGPRLYVIGERS
jgi:hypothetical protein